MNVLTAITDVFSAMISWVSDAFVAVIPMFYAETTGLTFLGVLAVASLAISVTFLIINVIQNFLHFRG